MEVDAHSSPVASELRGQRQEATAEGFEGVEESDECTGKPLPAEGEFSFDRHLECLGEELEEVGTGRPMPSHLDAFVPSEIDSEQREACARDRESAREVTNCGDSSLLNDALGDSVLALGRSVVDIPLPWEQESMSLVFGEDDSVTKLLAGLPKHIPVPAVSSSSIQPSDLVAEPPAKRARQMPESGECFRVAISSRAYDSNEEKEEAQWRRALEKWLVILTECPGSSYIGETVAIQKTDDAIETLRELFGRKSGSTVMKRGSALMGYLSWGRKECRGDDLFPFKSSHLDGYLKHLKREKRPAGAFTSFQECVNFAIHVVGIAVDESVIGPKQSTVWSHWSKGIIGQAQLTKAQRCYIFSMGCDMGQGCRGGEVTKWMRALLDKAGCDDEAASPSMPAFEASDEVCESESSDSSSESEPESGDEWVKGEDFRQRASLGSWAMGSLTESTAAFASRAKEIGLTQANVATITGSGVDTLSKLAFATVPPGQSPSDDQVQRLFGAAPITAGTMAAAKHLIFEAHTLVVQELKTRVQRGDSGAPSTLATAEREERITEQRARITGLLHRGVEEPSHASYDLVYAMLSSDSLTYLGPDRFPTRQSELQGKKPGKELTIDGNSVTVKDKELPPPTYVKISVAQVLRADRAAFTRIAEGLPSIKRQPDGTLPLDRALENILQDPSISFHLLPLKGGESDDNKRKWTDEAKKTDEANKWKKNGKGKGKGKGKDQPGVKGAKFSHFACSC
ncbi:unnamed protein product [Symbiodinium sp. CCMP2592]|nr:unnamed protein product [Symbiodinium sp. CCMP2592]